MVRSYKVGAPKDSHADAKNNKGEFYGLDIMYVTINTWFVCVYTYV